MRLKSRKSFLSNSKGKTCLVIGFSRGRTKTQKSKDPTRQIMTNTIGIIPDNHINLKRI